MRLARRVEGKDAELKITLIALGNLKILMNWVDTTRVP